MAALVRAAPPGSQDLATASQPQPSGDNGSKKSVCFSEVIEVFDGEGEDYFDKEFLRDLRKPLGSTFKHEVHTQEHKGLVQQALGSGAYPQTKDDEGDERLRQVSGGRGRVVTRSRGRVGLSQPCQVKP